jgi:carboxyl-terminal processing protease
VSGRRARLAGRWSARAIGACTVAALGMTPGTLAGQDAAGTKVVRARTTYEDLQMLSGVLNQLRVNHPDSLDTHQLLMAAIEGLVQAADPHSYVITATRMDPEREKAMRENKLFPVGINFEYYSGAPVVLGLTPGSQAAREDILPGDELIAIDGKPVAATSTFELDMTLAGPKGSTTSLVFEREREDGSVAQLTRTVKREKLDEASAVPTAFMLRPGVGYLRITTFSNDHVADDVHKALGTLESLGMTSLVLDLRDNPGGRVDQAADVAGEFLPKGAVVYSSEGRKADVAKTEKVSRSFFRSEKSYPILALVNEGTASAAELVAGALQDHDRALIWGRPTFGKSLLMQGFPLPDGSVFVMVIGHVKTPCGRVIQRDYKSITRHDYYRRARAERDTIGRPACKTDHGRTAYGGGGIYPDVRSGPRPATPAWAGQIGEGAIALRWAGARVTAAPSEYATFEALTAGPLSATALADFRKFAAAQGVTIPAGDDVDQRLNRMLLPRIADAKWGDAGFYRARAMFDPEVKAALESLPQATTLAVGR